MIIENGITLLSIEEYISQNLSHWKNPDSVKRAIRTLHFPATKRGKKWYINPAEAALYWKRREKKVS